MKKQFITLAFLATVALGGAFASQPGTTVSGNSVANKTVYYIVGATCTPISCSDINTNIPCIISGNVYTGKTCIVIEPTYLYRPQ